MESSGGRVIVSDLIVALRALSRQAVLFVDAIAERLGMASSDVECLEVLVTAGPATAGHLSDVTGLSTGAVTRMIDRLEQAGYVRRLPDPVDRRRVIVESVPERTTAIAELFESIELGKAAELDRYSDDDLRRVLQFVQRTLEQSRAEIARVRDTDLDGNAGGQTFAAPLGAVASGRLVFMSGFSDLALGADPALDRLFSAKFAGTPPRVRVRGGVVAIHAVRSARQWLNPQGEVSFSASIPFNFDLRRGIGKVKADVSPRVQIKTRGGWDDSQVRCEVLLNTTLPWDIDIRGGLSRLSADLRAIALSSLDITGGASTATILLPQARAWTPVRLIGGASDVTIQRPAGTALRLRVRGGVSGLDLDDQHFSSIGGGDVRLESREGGDVGYEVEITGGASRLTIDVAARGQTGTP
jgi:DNA-binding MarR family transcriptional regulator